MMKRLFPLLCVLTGMSLSVFSQADFEVANHKADPMTFVFDDNKHTVTGYIYSVLEKQTSCCGNDAMYLEVEYDNTGKVVNARTLTGKNDCYKQSVVDIVKSIRWTATGVASTKKVYFEVKPLVPCSGSPGENVYKPIAGASQPVAANTPPVNNTPPPPQPKPEPIKETPPPAPVAKVEPVKETPPPPAPVVKEEPKKEVPAEQPVAKVEPKKEEPPVAKAEPVKEVPVAKVEPKKEVPVEKKEEFLTESNEVADEWSEMYDLKESKNEPVVAQQSTAPANQTIPPPKKEVTLVKKPSPSPVSAPVAKSTTDPKTKVVIPPQASFPYMSSGDRKPDASHKESHINVTPANISSVSLAGDESDNSVMVRRRLRESGICGLATGLVEVTVDPTTGKVVKYSVVEGNSEKVKGALDAIAPQLSFVPQSGIRYNYITYFQFKTDIICEGEKRAPADLEAVKDYIIR